MADIEQLPENTIEMRGTAQDFEKFVRECGWMPAPRCDQCRWWSEYDALDGADQNWRRCGKTRLNGGTFEGRSNRFGPTAVFTHADFGCVQFEAKP